MVVRRQRFQFSVATGLKVVTGFCVVLSLTAWHPLFGVMLSSLIVGSWWSNDAVRAGRRKLAYYLSAWPMGVVAFVVGCWPLLWEFLVADEPGSKESLFVLAMMWPASLLTLTLLRRLIRKPGLGECAAAAVLAVYLTSFLFAGLTFVCMGVAALVMDRGPPSAEPILGMFCFGLIASVIWATVLMPVVWPIGVCFCSILRRIDPADVQEPRLSTLGRSVLEVVDGWRADEDGPLQAAEVAERLGIDTITAAEHLEILHGLKMIDKTAPDCYWRKGGA